MHSIRRESFCILIGSEFEPLFNVSAKLGHGHSHLLHAVAVTDGHAVIVFRLKVIGYAEGRSDLVLTAIALSDTSGLIIVNAEIL